MFEISSNVFTTSRVGVPSISVEIFYCLLANRGPALPGTKFLTKQYKGTNPNIYIAQSFFSCDLLRNWSLGYPGVRGSDWQGHACVKNLPRVGGEVSTKFGGDWSDGLLVKEELRYIYTNSVFYIYRFKIELSLK